MQECRQTRDRTNGHLVDSNTLLIELSSPLVKSVEVSNLRFIYVVLMNVYCNIPKFYNSLNIVVIMQKNEPKGFTIE